MAKTILFTDEARHKILTGVDKAANAVKITLGPAGQTVILKSRLKPNPVITKDGVSVAREIELEDEIENVGAMLMQQVANKTVDDCGDSTTTATVLAQSIIGEGLRQVAAKANPQDLKRGIDKAVLAVTNKIKELASPIGNDNNKIKDIATVSANNDSEIGGLIADAFGKMGSDGKLRIEDSATAETFIKVTDGVEIQRGYFSPYFVNSTDPKKIECMYENPLILIADYTLSTMGELVPVLEAMVQSGRPIIIMAADFEGEVISTIIANRMRGGLKIALIKAPATYKKEVMADIAVLTGATLITDEQGLKVENAKLNHCGTCDKIILTDKTTTFLGGKGNKDEIEVRKNEIRAKVAGAQNKEVKEVEENRLARISGSIGVIYVGAATEVEAKEKKDRIDDAIRSTKSAIEEGITVGGGVTLLRCIDVLKDVETDSDGEKAGVQIIAKALEAPLRQMLTNAGEDESYIVRKVMENEKATFGYNVKKREYQDLLENGIIDSAKAVRCSLQNAASVAGSIITSGCLAVEVTNKK